MANEIPTVVVPPDSKAKSPNKPSGDQVPVTDNKDQEESGGFVKSDLSISDQTDKGETISWTAPEFISYEKNSIWYIYVAVFAVVLSVVVYVLMKDVITMAVVIVLSVVFAVYGSRKPRQIPYKVDSSGFSIGEKSYSYEEFRMFNIQEEGQYISVNFMPLKRFAINVSLYFSVNDQEKILSALDGKLPYEHQSPSLIDDLMRRIKF